MRNKSFWTLKDVALISIGDMNYEPSSENLGADIDWIWSDNLKNCDILPTRRLDASVFRRSKLPKQILGEETILIGKYEGEVALGMTRGDVCINNSVVAVFPNERLVKKQFLFYALLFYKNEIERLTKGLNQNFLSPVRLRELCLPKVNIAQQNKLIADLADVEKLLKKFIDRLLVEAKNKKDKHISMNIAEGIQLAKVREDKINRFFKRSNYDA